LDPIYKFQPEKTTQAFNIKTIGSIQNIQQIQWEKGKKYIKN